MNQRNGEGRRGPAPLSELLAGVIDPVSARRGFAGADLIGAWPGIAGPLYADCTAPERIVWPRAGAGQASATAGVLFVRVSGPRAIFFQHELPQIVERINAFLGYAAIARIRIVQAPVAAKGRPAEASEAVLGEADERALATALAGVGSDGLHAALDRLGRAVHARPLKRT